MEAVESLVEASLPRLGTGVHTIYLCILFIYEHASVRQVRHAELELQRVMDSTGYLVRHSYLPSRSAA